MASARETSAARRPILALALTVVAAGLVFLPSLAAALEFRRERVLAGEPWRLATGHLVHATPGLALVDLAVFVALGAWWELRSRAAFVAIVVASALSASLALLAFTSFERYTGSSALGSGLFAALSLELALAERGSLRFAGMLTLALFVAKCALEAAGRGALFVVLPAGTVVAAAAHAAGGLAGALVVFARARRARQ